MTPTLCLPPHPVPNPWQLLIWSLFYSVIILRLLWKWNRAACKFWDWLFFTQCNSQQVHPGCCVNQQFIPFFLPSSIPWYGCSIVYLFTPWRASGLCPVLGCSEWSFHQHTYTGFCVSTSSLLRGQCPGVQLLACMAVAQLVLKTWSHCFQSSCTVLRSHQPGLRGPGSESFPASAVVTVSDRCGSHLIVLLIAFPWRGMTLRVFARALRPSVCRLRWSVCSSVHFPARLLAFAADVQESVRPGPWPLPGLCLSARPHRLACLPHCRQGCCPWTAFNGDSAHVSVFPSTDHVLVSSQNCLFTWP